VGRPKNGSLGHPPVEESLLGLQMARRRLFEHLCESSNKDLAPELSRICDEAAAIWRSQHLREFTVHGGPHYCQVEVNLDSLTANLQASSHPLSPEEIFVLIAACHLHDIGMQLGVPDAREKHAQYAYELILHSSVWVGPEQRKVTLPIHDSNARLAIAKVARGHWTDFALQLPEEDYLYGQTRGRLKLLGLLLATADLLDTSAIRAGYFRSDHRLFELNPVSELHQTLHSLVVGYQIKPEDSHVPDKLIFELEWRDKTDLVQRISEWQLRWFSSQIRQTASELEGLSGGAIRWATPWARVVFRNPEGPMPQLSDAATRVLNADLAAQRRINRDDFVKEFQKYLKAPSPVLFVLPLSSASDVKYVTEWCQAQVELSGFLVGQIDASPGLPAEIASIVAGLLEQWHYHLPVCNNETALRKLREFLENNSEQNVVLLAGAGDPFLLKSILEIVLERKDGGGARVALLRCPGDGPLLSNVEVRKVDLSSFVADDIRRHLQHRYGYNLQSQSTLVSKMAHLDLLTSPGRVYTYIEEHCDRDAWQNHLAK
jgi:hypothetical protein